MSDGPTAWVAVCPASEVAPGKVRVVEVAGRRLTVGRRSGGYFAVDDTCPHAGASLGEGMLDGDHLICPLHAFAYDTHTGRCEDDDSRLEVLEVREAGEMLEILLP